MSRFFSGSIISPLWVEYFHGLGRSIETGLSHGWAVGRIMQELLSNLHRVNEDFEYRPSTTGSGAVDLEQVLRNITG